jgi:hypothetical protein
LASVTSRARAGIPALLVSIAVTGMAAFGAAIADLDFQVIEAVKFHADEGSPVM